MGKHRHAQCPREPQRGLDLNLYFGVLGVCLTIFVLVGGWLLYTAVRFRERRGDTHEPPQTHGSTRLEIGWTIVPALIVIGILVFTLIKIPSAEKISSERDERERGRPAVLVHLHLPVRQDRSGRDPGVARGAAGEARFTSKDVDHDWWVPSLAPKIDALPGRTNYVGFTPDEVGDFEGACAEFCGIGHAGMLIKVKVVSQSDWDSQYKDKLT